MWAGWSSLVLGLLVGPFTLPRCARTVLGLVTDDPRRELLGPRFASDTAVLHHGVVGALRRCVGTSVGPAHERRLRSPSPWAVHRAHPRPGFGIHAVRGRASHTRRNPACVGPPSRASITHASPTTAAGRPAGRRRASAPRRPRHTTGVCVHPRLATSIAPTLSQRVASTLLDGWHRTRGLTPRAIDHPQRRPGHTPARPPRPNRAQTAAGRRRSVSKTRSHELARGENRRSGSSVTSPRTVRAERGPASRVRTSQQSEDQQTQNTERPVWVTRCSRAARPFTELPVWSRPGDQAQAVMWWGTMPTTPPPTPDLQGMPTRKANSPAAS